MELLMILKAIIMGIVQGITEFLPISSTGHLILFGQAIGFNTSSQAFTNSFNIIIQLGSIFAVIIYYKNRIWTSFKHLGPKGWGRHLWLNVIIAAVPAVIIGFIFRTPIKAFLYNVPVVSISLIVGGILLYLGEKLMQGKSVTHTVDKITFKDSLKIGLFQCLALIPGMSRSGSTITGALFSGLDRKVAAEFSFFLAIPMMFGATLVELKDIQVAGAGDWIILAVGFITTFVVSYFVVDFFLKFLSKHSLKGFAYYRIIVGILLLVLMFVGVLKFEI